MNVPVVDVFIHYKHSQPVADFQKRLGTGVVRRTDGVVSIFPEKPYFSLHRLRETCRSEDSVIMVDAGAPQDLSAAVDRQSLFRVPGKGANSEGRFRGIICKGDLAAIQVR